MRFLALLLLSWLCLYGADAVQSEKDTLASSLFTSNDATVSGSCSYGCRAVTSDYVTQIIDLDAKSGTTYCEVYSTNNKSKPLGVNANQTNTTCQEQNNRTPDQYNGQLVSSNTESSYKLAGATYDTGTITFSRFLAGMCTLDSDIIDFGATSRTGILQVKDPKMLYGTNISTTRQEAFFSNFGHVENGSTSSEIVSSVDSLNKSNLAYFANLFSSMSAISQYLQSLVFLLVSAFFVVMLGSQKLQIYLAKKEDNVNYFKKLFIPIIAVTVFYIPIPQENNMTTSLMQNIIQNTMTAGTKIADKAAIVGANVYLQKLYSSVGANTMSGEATIYAMRDSAKAQAAFYNTALGECKSRFPDAMTFQVSDADLAQKSIFNLNQVKEGVTAQGCRAIERKYLVQSKVYQQQVKYANQIKSSFSNNQLQNKLTQINTYLNNRQTELGWVNSALIPSAAILIEMMPMVNLAQGSILQDQQSNQEKIRNTYKGDDEAKGLFETIESIGQNTFGAILGKLTYLIVPGANTLFEVFNNAIKGGFQIIGFFAPGGGKLFSFINNSGLISAVGGAFIATMFIGIILKYIPLIGSMLAGILAIVGWLIEVLKYFYIAPFVVVFAVTLKKTDKISEFLVTGIIIFLKPVILVLFIYLGLFLYYLINDVFVMFAEEQFYLLDSINESFYVAMILHITLALIKIVACIASVYFMWKVILSGASFVIRLLGLNNSFDFIEPISQKLEKYSFT
ncbi:MAG: hypothetical protein H6Q35_1376 [Proteobacteria bacterium]|nr:hypothetical protein [Pseudomonadota bacterium]